MAVAVTFEPAETPELAQLLRDYFTEVIDRFVALRGGDFDVDEIMSADPGDDILMVAARLDGIPVGCGGLRLIDDRIGEIKRVYVDAHARGRGVGVAMMMALEAEAARRGLDTVRLDTRGDLVESHRLYARMGYREVEPFNDAPYADHWFAKRLVPPLSQ